MKQHRLRRDQERPDLPTTLEALRQAEGDKIPATVFYGLSGLNPADLEQVETLWATLTPSYRRKIMRRLVDISEANAEIDYWAIGWLGLDDPDAGAREAAVELLFEDMTIEMMDRLIEMAQYDEAVMVRAAAASALGRFILAGELGNVPEGEATRAQDAVVAILSNEDEPIEVRRRALEAIANCRHEIVPEAIDDAYNGHERQMRVSAVYAMGRTYDERWKHWVLREMDSDDAEMRFEAARAAGEIEIGEAVPGLVRMAQSNDREIKEIAIWSLGEIGGPDATRALTAFARRAEEAGDDDLLEVIDDALLNANLVDYELTDSSDWDD
jgi:HEAT repeat protein